MYFKYVVLGPLQTQTSSDTDPTETVYVRELYYIDNIELYNF